MLKNQPSTLSFIAGFLTFAALEADDLFESSGFSLLSPHSLSSASVTYLSQATPVSLVFPSLISAPELWLLSQQRKKTLYFSTNLPLPRPLLFPAPKSSPMQELQLISASRAKLPFLKPSQPPTTYSPSLSSSFLMYSRFTWDLISFAWKNVSLPIGHLWGNPNYLYPDFCNICILGKFLSFKMSISVRWLKGSRGMIEWALQSH